MTQPVIFISYSYKDERDKDRLLSHLGVVQREGMVNLWSDDQIDVGADWHQEIIEAIGQANVAILLISANFLTSDFILGEEIPALLQRRESEGLTIFPVIARPCAWQEVDWLARMKVRPKNGRPIWRARGRRIDEDLAALAQEIAAIVKDSSPESSPPTDSTIPSANPFHYGGPVLPERFVGHHQSLEFCQAKLRGPQPSNIAIIGERYIGKTSLLHYLSRYSVESDWGRYLCLFLDCGLFVGSSNPNSFWQEVLDQLRNKLEPASSLTDQVVALLSGPTAPTGPDFRRFLRKHYQLKSERPVLLLLDSFDLLFQAYNPAIQDLLVHLQVIAQEPENRFALITATQKPLDQVCQPFNQATHRHFHANFVSCHLDFFSEIEMHQVVQTLLADTHTEFSSGELNYIWQLSQGPEGKAYPIFVQVAAWLLFEHKQQGPVDYYYLEQKFQEQTELYQLKISPSAYEPQVIDQAPQQFDYERALTIIEDCLPLDDSNLILQFYSLVRQFRQKIQAEPAYHLSSTLYGEHSEIVRDLSRLSLQVTGFSLGQLAAGQGPD